MSSSFEDGFIHRRDAEDAEAPQRKVTERVIGAAIEVHRILGPGLLESAYQEALQHELTLQDLRFARQIAVPLVYKNAPLGTALRLDLVVEDAVIIEVKSVQKIEAIHEAQLLTYLRLTGLKAGLLLNFNVPALRHGIKRISNSLRPSADLCASAVKDVQ
jgi:GxxExxY protein